AILRLELFQPLRVRHAHAAELAPPDVRSTSVNQTAQRASWSAVPSASGCPGGSDVRRSRRCSEIYRFHSVSVISSIEPNDHVLCVVSTAGTAWCGRLALVRQNSGRSALPCT